jgi:hypothetical protein
MTKRKRRPQSVPSARCETEEDLVTEFLLRDVPLSGDQERRAMEAVGRLLLAKVPPECLGPDADCSQSDFACYMLAHMLLDGTITVKPVVRDRDRDIAMDVLRRVERPEKWEAAVAAVAEAYEVKRATVARACAKHREWTDLWRKSPLYTRPAKQGQP